MDDSERPILGLEVEAQIESAQHQTDANFWHQLERMQLLSPEAEKLVRDTWPTGRALNQVESLKDTDQEIAARTVLAGSFLLEGKIEEARNEIDQAVKLSKGSEGQDVELAIAVAKIHSASAVDANTRTALESCLAGAEKEGRVADQFAIRLALGEIELQSGAVTAARSRLVALRRDADIRGFVLIATKASQK